MKTIIKKTGLLLLGALFALSTKATIHTVTVQNFSFSPSSFTAVIGDTVEWVWVGGTHTTTSTSAPVGAATWNTNINSSATTFQYKITTAGTYNYQCNFHVSMGMVGSFTVSVAMGVPNVSASAKEIAKIFPNPATNLLNIHLNKAPNNNELVITDILGKEVIKESLSNIDNTIDISTWKKGVYLYNLKNNEEAMEGKFEVQ